jgi:hypothetical protein
MLVAIPAAEIRRVEEYMKIPGVGPLLASEPV